MTLQEKDELFEDQMRNLRLAANIAAHRDRPDNRDIAESCRWAESRLRHYREQEAIDDEIATEEEPTA